MNRRALITGSEGFAGRVLARRLRGNGWEVVGSDVNVAEESEALIRCDVSVGKEVSALFERAGEVTHVFHLAGMAYVPDAIADPEGAININMMGTMYVLSSGHRTRPRARYVVVSSSDIYGPAKTLPIDESARPFPSNHYAHSKMSAEKLCEEFGSNRGMEILRARPFNHSGPGQNERFVLSSFARQVAEIEAGLKQPVVRVGNLAAARDFSHVEDVARAYELLAIKGRPGEAYNICSGESHTIQEALEHLLALSNVPIRWEVDPERWRPETVHEVRGSRAKLTHDTGWAPERSFDAMLADILDDWRARVRREGA
jgi:GDP-4-dehydro-6-deoxy-D-mannose reductase